MDDNNAPEWEVVCEIERDANGKIIINKKSGNSILEGSCSIRFTSDLTRDEVTNRNLKYFGTIVAIFVSLIV